MKLNKFSENYFSFVSKVIAFLKKGLTFFVVIAIVVVVYFLYVQYSPKVVSETISLQRGTLEQIVHVTGPVSPTKEASLSFEKTGTITSVSVSVGDKVTSGQTLATLSGGDASAKIAQARATLASQQALLEQLTLGPRPEEIAIKNQNLQNAKALQQVVYSSLPDVIQDSSTKISDAVKNKIGNFFTTTNGKYALSFTTCDQKLQSDIETKRASFEKKLTSFQQKTNSTTIFSSAEEMNTTFTDVYSLALDANSLFEMLASILSTSCGVSSSYDSYKSSVSSAQNQVSVVITTINTTRQSAISATNAVLQAERDLTLTNAGTDTNKIKSQIALVSQAEASLVQAQVDASKNILTSPFDGVVTAVNVTKGEISSLGKNAFTVISSNAFQVEAKIPEADIAKVSLGNKVKITLDAYGKNVFFDALITRIDPGASIQGNVPVYRVIASFATPDERVKDGMTANVAITTLVKENVLKLPIRFVRIEENGSGLVYIVQGETEIPTKVELGLRGEDGLLEIVSGLSEKDTVRALIPGVRKAQKEN